MIQDSLAGPEHGSGRRIAPPARVALARSRKRIETASRLPHVRELFEPSGSHQLPQPIPRPLPARDDPEKLRDLCQPDEMLAHRQSSDVPEADSESISPQSHSCLVAEPSLR